MLCVVYFESVSVLDPRFSSAKVSQASQCGDNYLLSLIESFKTSVAVFLAVSGVGSGFGMPALLLFR